MLIFACDGSILKAKPSPLDWQRPEQQRFQEYGFSHGQN
jgi:hypothetical protein